MSVTTELARQPLHFKGHRFKTPSQILLLPLSKPADPVSNSLSSVRSFYTAERAATYDSSPFHQQLASIVAQTVISSCSSSDKPFRVLDLCCGTGLVARELAQEQGVDVVGLDASCEMLEMARGRTLKVRFVEGDASNPRAALGAASPLFDSIVCSSSMVFLSPTSSLLAWSQLLAPSPSSTIVFDVPTPSSSIRNVLLSNISRSYNLTPNFNRRWVESMDAVRGIVARTGTLVIRQVKSTGTLSSKKLATSVEAGGAVWEESLSNTNMNPFPEALALGIVSKEQVADARQSFIAEWTCLGDGAGSEVEETMENWVFVCSLSSP